MNGKAHETLALIFALPPQPPPSDGHDTPLSFGARWRLPLPRFKELNLVSDITLHVYNRVLEFTLC